MAQIKNGTSTFTDDTSKMETKLKLVVSLRDRNNNCVVCQTTDNLILKDIVIDKRLEILPYVSSNIQGSRNSPDEKIAYGSVKGKVGLGLNLDINKNTSFELTLKPRFFSSRSRCYSN